MIFVINIINIIIVVIIIKVPLVLESTALTV